MNWINNLWNSLPFSSPILQQPIIPIPQLPPIPQPNRQLQVPHIMNPVLPYEMNEEQLREYLSRMRPYELNIFAMRHGLNTWSGTLTPLEAIIQDYMSKRYLNKF